MSNESFRKFIDRVQNDVGLRQELQARSGEFGMTVEAMVAFAETKGYSFKCEDVSAELTGTTLAPFTGELNEARLKAVAGGGGPPEPVMPSRLDTYLSDGRLMFKFH